LASVRSVVVEVVEVVGLASWPPLQALSNSMIARIGNGRRTR